MRSPSLRQLEYVIAVADTGLFVEAARVCAVSQPALSKAVREVEDLLGVSLFERVRPRVIVTPVGAEIVRRARLLVADARELVEAARAASAQRAGTVRLGVIPTIAPYGLAGLLAKLRVLFPGVCFAIEELQTDSLLDQLRAGSIDLGLLARSFDDQGLAGVDVAAEPFVLVAPEGHTLGLAQGVRASDIAGASLILMRDGHCLRDQAMEVCASATQGPTTVSAASVSTLVRMVESGLGATLLPASALSIELRAGYGLVARSFEGAQPGRLLTLQWRSTSPDSEWYAQIARVLRDHYLQLNEGIPPIHGPAVRIAAPPSR